MNTELSDIFSRRTLYASLAEFIGTFFLTVAALVVAPSIAPFVVGLMLLVFVYTIGDISGCHINPAVTIGLVSSKRFPWGEGIVYIVFQILGALTARLVVGLGLIGQLAPDYQSAGITAEFIGFGLLMLTVAAVTENKVPKSGSGIAIGGALIAGLFITNGILNPAVAIAMGEGLSPAVWATILSGIVFALLFKLLKNATPPSETK